ncbi:MAG: adenosine kinase [Pseudomonadota bacterium]
MHKYDVYGVGNALVDFEFEVTETRLSELGIEKGVMTLIDEDQQIILMNNLSDTQSKKSSGGSAANTIIAVSQFGGSAYYSCKVANDDTGDFYLADLQACGVDSNLNNNPREYGHTGKCVVMVTPDADRTMNTFLGITGDIAANELDPNAIADSTYTYLEGYLASSETGHRAAIDARDHAKQAGLKTALTLSDPNMVRFFKGNLEKMLGDGVDLLFCNELEALEFTGMDSISDAASALSQKASTTCITLGAKGALIVDSGQNFEIPAYPTDAVDSNGAGDMFAGAFLYGITHGMSIEEAGNLASRSAAKVVGNFGARLSSEQVSGLKN